MRAGSAFGPDEEEEELDRVAVERIVIHRSARDAGGDYQPVHEWRPAVWHGNAIAESSRHLTLALKNGAKDCRTLFRCMTRRRELHQLTQHLILRSAIKRDLDMIRVKELREKHDNSRSTWDSGT